MLYVVSRHILLENWLFISEEFPQTEALYRRQYTFFYEMIYISVWFLLYRKDSLNLKILSKKSWLSLRKKKFKLSLVWPIITSIQGTNPVSMNPCIMILVGLEPLKVDVVIVKGCERLRNLGGWCRVSLVVRRNLVFHIVL